MNSLNERLKSLEEELKSVLKQPSTKTTSLEERLRSLKELERDNKIQQEIGNIKRSYLVNIPEVSNTLQLIEYTCRFIEENCQKFSLLLDCNITSIFKKNLALSLLEEFGDLDVPNDSEIIDYVCKKTFPHRVVHVVEPIQNKKSFSIKKKTK